MLYVFSHYKMLTVPFHLITGGHNANVNIIRSQYIRSFINVETHTPNFFRLVTFISFGEVTLCFNRTPHLKNPIC